MEGVKQPWLAAYLYYGEPWETFLLQGVEPFIRMVKEKGEAGHYFFIRYWEKGPHIRLRFQGDGRCLETVVKPWLEGYFQDYYRQYPSVRKEPGYLSDKNLPVEQQWYPNDSVQFIPYEPEVERYGGPVCMGIAEEQFEYSSEAVFAVMRESEGWDYDRALGAAIQLHLGFAFAMGMDMSEATAFFNHIFSMWFYRSYAGYNTGLSQEELVKRREATMKAFQENFARQKQVLVPFHETLWDGFHEAVGFEQEWLNQWLRDMGVIHGKLVDAQVSGQMITPSWWPQQPQQSLKGISLVNYQQWAILESYIHMTNNRLGILNHDEAFLGYLIKESLNTLFAKEK